MLSIAAIVLVLADGHAQEGETRLPDRIAVPDERPPDDAGPTVADDKGDPDKGPGRENGATTNVLPETPPLPRTRPETADRDSEGLAHAGMTGAGPAVMPESERACRVRLTALGARFTERQRLTDPDGCGVDYPIEVTRLSRGIGIEPLAVLNCTTAEAAATFFAEIVSPAAEEAFGSRVSTVANASGYVCRPRNGTQKLSEHAFGNALDISALLLADGTRLEIHARGPEEKKVNRFMQQLRDAACGPFKTVLGPGTDADHADHFHFDLAERRNGGTYCR